MEQTHSFFNSKSLQLTLKIALVFLLTIILIIPKFLILDLIRERKGLQTETTLEVTQGWGTTQVHTGPVLVIPYTEYQKNTDNSKTPLIVNKNLLITPKTLDIVANAETQTKYRSIYEVLLYKSDFQVKGQFQIPTEEECKISHSNMNMDKAFIALGQSDLKGIEDKVIFEWDNTKYEMKAGTEGVKFSYSIPILDYHSTQELNLGLHRNITIGDASKVYNFSYSLKVKGHDGLYFAPLGETTTAKITSSFADPSFVGGFLPENTVNDSGFVANWNILSYNKSIPGFTSNQVLNIGENTFGVRIQPLLDSYSKANRAGKYMLLVVILTFLVVLITEIVEKSKIHIFQYTLVGISIAIFFVLLLSISEYFGFDNAFVVAAIATTTLLYLYSTTLFTKRQSSYLLLALLLGVFGYIYMIIQLEKAALLVGSIGLFAIIAATMYATRKIAWYESQNSEGMMTSQ